MAPHKISAVIITYNEEKNIRRCLESLQGIVDEIVVVDSFSTDGTQKVCNEFDVRFIEHEFEGHIEQKNWAAKQAQHDYVLSLDADEVLSEKLRESILQLKSNQKWLYEGYRMHRLTSFCGKWMKHSWYPDTKLRLWNRHKGNWGGKNPHDEFLMNKGLKTGFLKGDILHYSFHTVEEYSLQQEKFTSISASAMFDRGERTSIFSIYWHAIGKFFRNYFLKLGFLDGNNGLFIALSSAYFTLLKYMKLYKLQTLRQNHPTVCFMNTTHSWGGGEQWHYDHALALADSGYNVAVITNTNSKLADKLKGLDNLSLVQIHISNVDFLNPLRIFQLKKVFKRLNISTIIFNDSSGLKVGSIAAKMANIEQIIYRRGLAKTVKGSYLNRLILKNLLTHIIANSEETKRTMLHHFPEVNSKVTVMYNGFNLDRFLSGNAPPVYHRKKNELIIGNAGRLTPQKGQKYLLDLAERLIERGVDFKILIAGVGDLEEELRNQIDQRNLTDHVMLIGFVDNMKSFMESIDVFVLSSLWEGFGFVLTEAMACKKPVIAFDITSNPELIDNGENGFLVPLGDITSLSEKVLLLDGDRTLINKMGENGYQKLINSFTMDISIKNLEQVIKLPV